MRLRPVPTLLVLTAISVGLSGLILAQPDDLAHRRAAILFRAEDPPEAVAELLHVAGLSPRGGDNHNAPLAAMEAKAIGGKDGKVLELAGVAFLPAIQLGDGETKYKAKYPALAPGKRGTVFPMLVLSAVEDTKTELPAVQVEPKGDTKLLMKMDDGSLGEVGGIEASRLKKDKATMPPKSLPFALAGKLKVDDKVGMFKMPVLEYRKFAKRIHEAKAAGRGGMVQKRVPGSLSKVDEARELYVDQTRLGTYQLAVGLRGGEAASFEIKKKP